jgi:hypothetical protein
MHMRSQQELLFLIWTHRVFLVMSRYVGPSSINLRGIKEAFDHEFLCNFDDVDPYTPQIVEIQLEITVDERVRIQGLAYASCQYLSSSRKIHPSLLLEL